MTIRIAKPGEYTVTATPSTSTFFSVVSSVNYVGGYQMGDIRFNLTRKPSWWHRLGVRLVLGWRWVDGA